MKKEYVVSVQETRIVSKVREEYIKEYADFLIQKAKIRPTSVVVDVPCGTGDMAKAIVEKVPCRFILIDVNANMISAAKERLSNKHVFIIGESRNIGTTVKEKVDAILCLNGFHLYTDRKKDFLKGCAEILKVQGVLIFDVSTRGLHDVKTKAFFQKQHEEIVRLAQPAVARMPGWPDSNKIHKYELMAVAVGFEVQRIEFTSWKTVNEVLSHATIVPGRSRPWIPELNDAQRKEVLTKATTLAEESTRITRIEHNRTFLVCMKKK